MIQHVYERACQSAANEVVIATDDARVTGVARDFGAVVCQTDPAHQSGTDRLAEVARTLGFPEDAVVVNVQGDEPLIPPANIDQVALNLANRAGAAIATLAEPVLDAQQLTNPNVVNVVTDEQGFALYFSRACIPWPREGAPSGGELSGWQRHIGIYAYRAAFLQTYVAWPQCALEITESLEQLRALWYGARIHVEKAGQASAPGVDTEQDLALVRELIEAA